MQLSSLKREPPNKILIFSTFVLKCLTRHFLSISHRYSSPPVLGNPRATRASSPRTPCVVESTMAKAYQSFPLTISPPLSRIKLETNAIIGSKTHQLDRNQTTPKRMQALSPLSLSSTSFISLCQERARESCHRHSQDRGRLDDERTNADYPISFQSSQGRWTSLPYGRDLRQ